MKQPKTALIALALSLSISSANTPDLSETFFNNANSVILFLGDSITADGGYIRDLQALLLKKFPKLKARFVNVGISGESMPGLMKRLDGVLSTNKPSLVFSTYGMNDGGYNPLNAANLKAYHDSVATLLAKVTKAGAPLILMTPTAFDSLTAVPLIVNAPPYYFKSFFRGYDSVLTAYGNSVFTFKSSTQMIIDIQNPLRVWAKAQRRTNPTFAWTAEGVHPTPAGHQVMADAIFAALFPPPSDLRIAQPSRTIRTLAGRGEFSVNGARSRQQAHPGPVFAF
ncbi:MAG: family lipolytic protein [Fibrobacteres bacterium]|nr:family lipolytic protein [Fibrobacterota bacterium]